MLGSPDPAVPPPSLPARPSPYVTTRSLARNPQAGLVGAVAFVVLLFAMVMWGHEVRDRALPGYVAVVLLVGVACMAVSLPLAGTLTSGGEDAGSAVAGEAMRDLTLAVGVVAFTAGADRFLGFPSAMLSIAWGIAVAALVRGVVGFGLGECFALRQQAAQQRADDARYGWWDRAEIERVRAERDAKRKQQGGGWGTDLY